MSRWAFALGGIGPSFEARGRMPRLCHLPGCGMLRQKLVGCLNTHTKFATMLPTLVISNDAWHHKQRPCPLEHLL